MRIPCPYCGERDRREFTVLGGADAVRPDGIDDEAGAKSEAMFAYVYQRANPAGLLREYWYHGVGCHAWLVVERDTRTHAIKGVTSARQTALARQGGGA
jgi:sarcosine oxidase subunit delta